MSDFCSATHLRGREDRGPCSVTFSLPGVQLRVDRSLHDPCVVTEPRLVINLCREARQAAKPHMNILPKQLLFLFTIQKHLLLFPVGRRQENVVGHEKHPRLCWQPHAGTGRSPLDPARLELTCR